MGRKINDGDIQFNLIIDYQNLNEKLLRLNDAFYKSKITVNKMNKALMQIEGTFRTGEKCKFHCSPTCHPGQVDLDKWHYGCTHKSWPENKNGDFCPLVDCDGDFGKCEMRGKWFLGRYKGGKTLSLRYTEAKVKRLKEELKFIEEITKKI